MSISKSMSAGLCVSALVAVLGASPVRADVGIYLNLAPPALRHENVPPPRRGFQWAPGYWDASRNRHVWRAGHWERQRAGYHYTEPSWTQRDNRWQLQRGRWERGDSDRDGVPNGADRAPNNPTRR